MFIPPTGIRPSYHQGFARSAGESAYPGLWRGLVVAYCPLLGITGNILFDQTPYKNQGVLTNMEPSAWVISRIGQVLDFDGSNDYISITQKSKLPIHSGGSLAPISFFFSVKGVSAQINKTLFGESNTLNDGNNALYWMHTSGDSDSKISVLIRNDITTDLVNNIDSTGDVMDGNFHTVGWTDNVGDAALYIDGVVDASNYSYTPTGTFTFNSDNIGSLIRTIGAEFSINAKFGCFYLYNRKIVDSEILQLHKDQLAPFQLRQPVWKAPAMVGGRIMSSLTNHGGLAGRGGIAGIGGGLAG